MDKFSLEKKDIYVHFKRDEKMQHCPWGKDGIYCGDWCPFFEVLHNELIYLHCVSPVRVIGVEK